MIWILCSSTTIFNVQSEKNVDRLFWNLNECLEQQSEHHNNLIDVISHLFIFFLFKSMDRKKSRATEHVTRAEIVL